MFNIIIHIYFIGFVSLLVLLVGYVTCSILYMTRLSYKDSVEEVNSSKNYLDDKDRPYHNNAWDAAKDRPYHNNAWDAAKYGASKNLGENFITSVIWPFALTSEIVPYIISKL